jgi:hypothetical protein
MPTTKFVHQDPDAPAEQLAKEADDFLALHPELQFVVELLTILRELKLPWWTPTQRRQAYNATQRMRDITNKWVRQRITMGFGALQNAALKMTPDHAAANIDLALNEGDRTDEYFEDSFTPAELVLYGNPELFYAQFRQAMPWTDSNDKHRRLVASLIDSFLKPRGEPGNPKTQHLQPILTHNQVLSAIPRSVWQKCIKPEVLEEVDRLLLEKERENPEGPFTYAKYVMSVVTSDIITRDIPLLDLFGIFEAAEEAMGFKPLEAIAEVDREEPTSSTATTVSTAEQGPKA